jgi:uncharacterized protein YbaA (DUF1428 family)
MTEARDHIQKLRRVVKAQNVRSKGLQVLKCMVDPSFQASARSMNFDPTRTIIGKTNHYQVNYQKSSFF